MVRLRTVQEKSETRFTRAIGDAMQSHGSRGEEQQEIMLARAMTSAKAIVPLDGPLSIFRGGNASLVLWPS
jgi:hypothetical protein